MNKSFTLIEILVVIVVIGILSSFIVIITGTITDNANIAKTKVFLNSLDNSLLLARVSQWKLDSNANDSWGTNPGTWSDAGGGEYTSASWRTSSECVSDGCLAFDGTDDRVNCGNVNITGETLTMSAWFYSTATNIGWILAKNNLAPADIQYGFYKDTSSAVNRIYVYLDGISPAQSPVNSISNNKWYNVAVLYNGTNVAIYINGSLSRTPQNYSTSLLSTSYDLNIGKRNPDNYFFGGLIDDVRIYNQAISTSEIQENYFLGINNLYKNNGITNIEYTQRITKLKSDIAKN